jgi:hypothetical protein
MHLYIAGFFESGTGGFGVAGGRGSTFADRVTPKLKEQQYSVNTILSSYHYIAKSVYPEAIRQKGLKIFLDSGAFSAKSKGITIDLEEYAQFIKDNDDIIRMASVLDVIGDCDASWINQQKLEALGCQVIPCFHQSEPIEACRYYVANYPYISLGGIAGGVSAILRPWLDEVFTEAICDKDGYAKCKVHGFGMTSLELMERYPWYSVDSTSWLMTASFGSIVFPELKRPISISERSPSRKDLGQHYSTLTDWEKSHLAELAALHGLDMEVCVKDYVPRYIFNAYAFHEIGIRMGEDHWRKPFKHRQRSLF